MRYLSHIKGKCFKIRHGKEYSDLKQIAARVPQRSVLGLMLYLLYNTSVIFLVTEQTLLATFADDTVVLAVDDNINNAIGKLQ